MESPSTKRKEKKKHVGPKAKWEDSRAELFLNICLSELTAGNRPGTSFNKRGWENILGNYNKETNCDYNLTQIKNKWSAMKRDWSLWKKLETSTGVGWDDSKNTIRADPEWWERKIEENPDAVKYRDKGPLCVELQSKLFDDIVSIGLYSYTPSSGILPSGLDEVNYVDDDYNDIYENANHSSSQDPVNNTQPFQSVGGVRLGATIASVSKRRKSGRNSNSDLIAQSVRRMTDHTEGMSIRVAKNDLFSAERCMEVLEHISELKEGDHLYCYATKLFIKQVNREIFLKMKTNEGRLKWIEFHYRDEQDTLSSSLASTHRSMSMFGSDATSPHKP